MGLGLKIKFLLLLLLLLNRVVCVSHRKVHVSATRGPTGCLLLAATATAEAGVRPAGRRPALRRVARSGTTLRGRRALPEADRDVDGVRARERRQSALLRRGERMWLSRPGGRVTNAVGTIFRKIFVGTRARPI